MEIKSVLLILVKTTIFSLMLAMGINLSWAKMLSFWRKPALLCRALLAVVVFVPLLVVLLLKVFNLPQEVMAGLAFLAVSPGTPLMTRRLRKAGANFQDSASLQLTLALLAVFVTPITLNILMTLFGYLSVKVTILEVARQVTMVQFLPVCLALLMQKFAPKFTTKIAQPLTVIANGLFLVLIVLACIVAFPLFLKVQGLSMVAIAIMVIVSLGIGHILAGPDNDQQSVLAISCIARNIGLALFIAILNDVHKQVIPTLVAYTILGSVLGVVYSVWNKRKLPTSPE
jgi:BASS family bile acid:Na+ symporter